MAIIIQNRNQRSSAVKSRRKRPNVNLGKALSQYNAHMKKVNKRMYG